MGRRLLMRGTIVIGLAVVLCSGMSGGLHAEGRAAAQPAPVPTAVIAGLHAAPAHGYLDVQGRYHSALAPYTVRSHWPAEEIGGPEAIDRNDRFLTDIAQQRYIDVIAVPNPQKVDTARAERLLWDYLVKTGLQPHVIGRLRVLGAWVPIIGLTSVDTGQPHARIVFATAQHVWVMDLATAPRASRGDLRELLYMGGTFHLAECTTAARASCH